MYAWVRARNAFVCPCLIAGLWMCARACMHVGARVCARACVGALTRSAFIDERIVAKPSPTLPTRFAAGTRTCTGPTVSKAASAAQRSAPGSQVADGLFVCLFLCLFVCVGLAE